MSNTKDKMNLLSFRSTGRMVVIFQLTVELIFETTEENQLFFLFVSYILVVALF